MKYTRALLINSTFANSEHEIIDSSLAIALSSIVKIVNVSFIKHRNERIKKLIKQHSDNNNIIFNNQINFTFYKLPLFAKEFITALQEVLLFLIRGGRDTVTFLTYENRYNIHFLNCISKITKYPLIICVHGEAENVSLPLTDNDSNWTKLTKRFYWKTKLGEHVRMMVLSENIKEELFKRLPQNQHYKFISWDHPYFEITANEGRPLTTPIQIGIIGSLTHRPERGFDNVVEFAKQLLGHSDIKLSLLSTIESSLLDRLPSNIEIKNPTHSFVDREIYDKWINELHYIYCPYPEGSFEMTASAALLDAITKNKPVIMHANGYAVYLRRKFGEFGLLLKNDNWQEIITLLTDINTYNILLNKQKKVVLSLTPESNIQPLQYIISNL